MTTVKWSAGVVALFGLGSTLAASEYSYIYTQPLEGVYSQGWHSMHLRENNPGRHEKYVRGEGKLGDFFGVLWLDCVEARYSNWLSVGGHLTQDDVPIEVIKKIRKTHC